MNSIATPETIVPQREIVTLEIDRKAPLHDALCEAILAKVIGDAGEVPPQLLSLLGKYIRDVGALEEPGERPYTCFELEQELSAFISGYGAAKGIGWL